MCSNDHGEDPEAPLQLNRRKGVWGGRNTIEFEGSVALVLTYGTTYRSSRVIIHLY
jgi:hypothetical protein